MKKTPKRYDVPDGWVILTPDTLNSTRITYAVYFEDGFLVAADGKCEYSGLPNYPFEDKTYDKDQRDYFNICINSFRSHLPNYEELIAAVGIKEVETVLLGDEDDIYELDF